MKKMLMMAGLAFLLGSATMATIATASEQGCCSTFSVSRTVGNEKQDTQLACNPSNGNWVNDAHITCPMRGSGAGRYTITREITICHDYKNEDRS